jgi:hypothetical protein
LPIRSTPIAKVFKGSGFKGSEVQWFGCWLLAAGIFSEQVTKNQLPAARSQKQAYDQLPEAGDNFKN